MLNRRGFMKLAAFAAASGISFPAHAKPKKKLIVFWLEGGPSQLDTFDPKPGTEQGGPFAAIETAARGIRISEHLPLIAKEMKSVALVRSMTSREGSHPRARYLLHTGYIPGGGVHHPALGAVIANELGDADAALPQYVALNGVIGGSGFLGAASAPFFVPKAGEPSGNLHAPAELDEARYQRRLGLLEVIERGSRVPAENIAAHAASRAKALRMMRSEKARAFELDDEPEKTRRAYGENELGRAALVARRLVESGVSAVEIVQRGWDTHQENFERVKELSGALDPAAANLIADLRARGLLEETLVVIMGEFGRTPRINGNKGRDHFANGYTVALAGAGIRGGTVIGATSSDGTRIAERPVTVPELFATIYKALGVDLERTFQTPVGRPIQIVNDRAKPIGELI